MALLSLIEVAQKNHHQEQEISFMEAASVWPTSEIAFSFRKHCNIKELQAKFDQEIVYVLLPKPVSAKDGRPTNEMKQYGGVLKALSKRRRLIPTAVAAILLEAGLGQLTSSSTHQVYLCH
ncbi:unnamed protein product [Musa banksii]